MPSTSITTTITRRYHFEAAHWLPKVHEDHKCHRIHGHNYEIEVTCDGPTLDNGFIIDFWDLDEIVRPLIETVDHRTLNDIPGLENPTAELIAGWFLRKIGEHDAHGLSVFAVRVYETKDCWADATR